MLPYILTGLYLLIVLFVFYVLQEIDSRKPYAENEYGNKVPVDHTFENTFYSIFWLSCAGIILGTAIIAIPIIILDKCLSPIVKKFVDFLESENKKEK